MLRIYLVFLKDQFFIAGLRKIHYRGYGVSLEVEAIFYSVLPMFYRKISFLWTIATITIHHIITVNDFHMHNGN